MVIAPWNYPYLTAINTIVPGLLAGNAIILKHAAQTLLVGERFAEAFRRAGLPKGLFHNLVMSHEQTEKLIGSGRIDHINFTGSVAGGRAIERATAGTFASLGLELGGKDPAYVRADAKLDHAIENLVDGAFYNSGQCCCGVERIYVDAPLLTTSSPGFADLTRNYVVGNPLDQATTLGPMARGSFADTVRGQIAEAKRKGATALINMKVEGDRPGSPYLAPEVLTNVNHQMEVMREESFGPVVGIMKVRDDEEAITLMNDSLYGLTASIWTRDIDRAAEIGARIETGTVFMNRCDYLDPHLVWTGVKDTGRGASAVEIRLRRADPAEELSPPRSLTGFLSRNIRHEHTDRQLELSDRRQIRRRPHQGTRRGLPQRGDQSPAARHRRRPRQVPHHRTRLRPAEGCGLPVAMFADVQPNPVDANVEAGIAAVPQGRP